MRMRRSLCLMGAAVLLALTVPATLATEKKAGVPALEDAIRLDDQTLPAEKAVELALPPLPARPGKTVVLRFRMVSYARTEAGCNMHGRVALNGTPLGRYLASGDERLIGRAPSFEFTVGHPGSSYPVFNGTLLVTMFAPDVDGGDRMSTDGLGASFVLDVSDVARGVDGNSLSIRNLRKPAAAGERVDLIVRDIAVGWLDRGEIATAAQPGAQAPAAGDRGYGRLDSFGLRPSGRILGIPSRRAGTGRGDRGGHESQGSLGVDRVRHAGPRRAGTGVRRTVGSHGLCDDGRVACLAARANRGNQRRAGRVEGTLDQYGPGHRGRSAASPVVPAERPDPVLPGGDHRPGGDCLQRGEPDAVPGIEKERWGRIWSGGRERLAAAVVWDAGPGRRRPTLFADAGPGAGREHRFHAEHHARC